MSVVAMIENRDEGLVDFVSRCAAFKQSYGNDKAIAVKLVPLGGDASARRYFRVAQTNFIAADSPPQSQKNEEFVKINSYLAKNGLRVPRIFNADLERGFFLLEDLGDTQFAVAAQGQRRRELYLQAADLLPKIADIRIPDLPPFDYDFIATEMGIFREWMLGRRLNLSLGEDDIEGLEETTRTLARVLAAQPQVPMHRDFHSRNLMLCAGGRLALLDYQDMVRGPLGYDAASLIYDCYVNLPSGLVDELICTIYQGFKNNGLLGEDIDEKTMRFWLVSCSLQRHLKVLGIFERLSLRDGKHGYLADLPRVYAYALSESAAYPEYGWMHEFLRSRVGGRF